MASQFAGFVLSFFSAFMVSAGDLFRKRLSHEIGSSSAMSYLGISNAILSIAFCILLHSFEVTQLMSTKNLGLTQAIHLIMQNIVVVNPNVLWAVIVLGSILRVAGSYFYTRALQLAPMSAVVPYSSLTPVILLIISFVFLNEVPPISGILGVICISGGAFHLSQSFRSEANPGKFPTAQTDIEDQSLSGSSSPSSSLPTTTNTSNISAGISCMTTAAFIWSLTTLSDKLGTTNLSSPMVYLALEKSLFAALILVFMAYNKYTETHPPAGKNLSSNGLLDTIVPVQTATKHLKLFCMGSFVETVGLTAYIYSLTLIYTSYAVAIKRLRIIFSVALGSIAFRESIAHIVPSVAIIVMGGLLMIIYI